jgi:hypothetical protein
MSETISNETAPELATTAPVTDSFQSELDAFTREIEAEFKFDPSLSLEDAPTEPTVSHEGATEASAAPVEVQIAEKQVDPAVERGLERLVAREVEVRGREEALSRRELEYKAIEARLKEAEARAIPTEFLKDLEETPTDTLKKLGLDPDDFIRRAIAERLPQDKVPDTLRSKINETKTQRQLRLLEAKVIEQQRAASAREYFTQVDNGARTFVSSELSKHADSAPTVARVAKQAPDRVHHEIMQEIIADARARASQEPNGSALPYAEAVKRVEARWAEYHKLLAPSPEHSRQEPEKTVSQVAQAKPVSKTGVADKPLVPWLQREARDEDGIRAGILEWKKVQGIKP